MTQTKTTQTKTTPEGIGSEYLNGNIKNTCDTDEHTIGNASDLDRHCSNVHSKVVSCCWTSNTQPA